MQLLRLFVPFVPDPMVPMPANEDFQISSETRSRSIQGFKPAPRDSLLRPAMEGLTHDKAIRRHSADRHLEQTPDEGNNSFRPLVLHAYRPGSLNCRYAI